MTNLDAANIETKEAFFAAYEKAKSAKKDKQAINTAALRIDEQVERFANFSQSVESEQALYEDALSV